MKLRASCIVALLIGLTMLAVAVPSVYPTGTTLYNPAKAFNTFVLITGGDGSAHLIDMNGNSVHSGRMRPIWPPTSTLGCSAASKATSW
jgi:hypothetical protein